MGPEVMLIIDSRQPSIMCLGWRKTVMEEIGSMNVYEQAVTTKSVFSGGKGTKREGKRRPFMPPNPRGCEAAYLPDCHPLQIVPKACRKYCLEKVEARCKGSNPPKWLAGAMKEVDSARMDVLKERNFTRSAPSHSLSSVGGIAVNHASSAAADPKGARRAMNISKRRS